MMLPLQADPVGLATFGTTVIEYASLRGLYFNIQQLESMSGETYIGHSYSAKINYMYVSTDTESSAIGLDWS